jgi:2',3'-cyclic-nucleotide 2'-phosphodiesterase (5'-nucleotidase family)
MGIKSWIFLAAIVVQSCAVVMPPALPTVPMVSDETHRNVRIDSNLVADPDILAFLHPYSSRLTVSMGMVIAEAPYDITKAKPEGALGNLTADMVRNAMVSMRGHVVHMAVINNGGLRVPLYKGPITVGRVYELMPFDNTLVLLKLNGAQVLKLADEIAAFGGEPVSGIRFRIDEGKAADVLLGVNSVNPEAEYWVATHNYLADGGGDFPTLWKPLERIDFAMNLRDVFIREFIYHPNPEPRLEGRIR